MKVTVTGATGTLGAQLVKLLTARGDEVTVLSRNAESAREKLGGDVRALEWRDPKAEVPPAESLAGQEGVVHLLGEPVAQRWSEDSKREIRDSRVLSTRNLVAALGDVDSAQRPKALVSQSATGWYGARGDERVDESEPAAGDFLAQVCVEWEAEARAAEELGVPVAGGKQYVPWIHTDDVVAGLAFALDTEGASGPVNLTAPEPVTNKELSKTLGRVLKRPAIAPVPALAIKALYGEMAIIVTTGVRAVPKRLEELGYTFRQPELERALRSATGK